MEASRRLLREHPDHPKSKSLSAQALVRAADDRGFGSESSFEGIEMNGQTAQMYLEAAECDPGFAGSYIGLARLVLLDEIPPAPPPWPFNRFPELIPRAVEAWRLGVEQSPALAQNPQARLAAGILAMAASQPDLAGRVWPAPRQQGVPHGPQSRAAQASDPWPR
ncbi:MAG: hypothetical protein K6T75_00195 [Acetobacteraceae bacterium]|nr:hypothetical protein [Acetobacteraceae bacterium]